MGADCHVRDQSRKLVVAVLQTMKGFPTPLCCNRKTQCIEAVPSNSGPGSGHEGEADCKSLDLLCRRRTSPFSLPMPQGIADEWRNRSWQWKWLSDTCWDDTRALCNALCKVCNALLFFAPISPTHVRSVKNFGCLQLLSSAIFSIMPASGS